MTNRLTGITLALALAGGGCVTTTAHQLVLTDNPLRDQAIACERQCQPLRVPAQGCVQTPGHEGCTVPIRGDDVYAACLDKCPGSRAKDGASCDVPPIPGVICVETTRANAGGIAGGVAGGTALVTVIVVAVAVASSPLWLLLFFAAN